MIFKVGAREPEVDEPDCGSGDRLNRIEPVLCIEFEAYPEAKLLKPKAFKTQ